MRRLGDTGLGDVLMTEAQNTESAALPVQSTDLLGASWPVGTIFHSCPPPLSPSHLPLPPALHSPWQSLPCVGAAKHTAGLTLLFRGSLSGKKCTVLLDSGASFSFIDQAWLYSHPGLCDNKHICGLKDPIMVAGVNHNLMCIDQQFSGTLNIQQAKIPVQAKIVDRVLNGVDIILGNDILKPHQAILNYGNDSCELKLNGQRKQITAVHEKAGDGYLTPQSIPAASAATELEVLSPKQAHKLLKQGASSWLTLVQPDNDGPDIHKSCASLGVAPDAQPQVDPHVLRSVQEEFQDVFEPITSCPPPRSGVEHTIRLQPGANPPFRRPYRLSWFEEEELHKQIQELLAKGMIEPSASPYGAPVLFVQKKDGSLRMCLDYRALNKLTVRDRYPLPRIDDLLDKLHGCTVFSSLDLQAGYHQIRISEEDKDKTAIVTPFGQYQFKVLCFGLTNAPATFQRVMNTIFQDHLGKCVLVYLDDILVMSRSAEEHVQHLRLVLSILRAHHFKAKLSKCEFAKPELHFLGHIVGQHGVKVDPSKIAVILKWPVPRSLKELQAFLGLANYFRKFVHHYSSVAAPLTELCSHKASSYDWNNWGQAELSAFEQIKHALVTAPVLTIPDPKQPFAVQTDASVVGTGGILLQNNRVVAYTSAKFSPAEHNYFTYEQELLALYRALQVWRCYLEMSTETILLTDHNPLVHLFNQAELSRRQARWMEFFSRFPFILNYIPGKRNIADPLSRHPLLYRSEATGHTIAAASAFCAAIGSCAAVTRRAAKVMEANKTVEVNLPSRDGHASGRPGGTNPHRVSDSYEPAGTDSYRPPTGGLFSQGGEKRRSSPSAPPSGTPDGSAGDACERHCAGNGLHRHKPHRWHCPSTQSASDERASPDTITLSHDIMLAYNNDDRFRDANFTKAFKKRFGLWMLGHKIVVPKSKELRTWILEACHDNDLSGHVGINKTYDLVSRHFHWEGMRDDVSQYVRHCDACQLSKPSTKAYGGKLQPLPIPGRRWEHVSMDMIVKLPQTVNGHDSILVFVDRLSKMVHLVPTVETLSAEGFAKLFRDWVIRLHGMPETVLSDRGPQFNSMFWDHVTRLTGVKRSMSSAYHPQTDGQTERINRTLEEMLRSYVSPDQQDWDEHLACVEFAINNSWQESVKNTPFFLNYGMHPLTPVSMSLPRTVPRAHDFVQGIERAVKRAKQALQSAQDRMRNREDPRRRVVTFQPGERVLLSTKNLRNPQVGVKKLKPSYMGPFTVEKMVGNAAVKLRLPAEWTRVHNVFHVSLLKPFLERSEGRQGRYATVPPPPVQYLDGEPLYTVEALLDHEIAKDRKKRPYYRFFVKWEGYSDENNKWEPESNLLTCDEMVDEYKRRNNLPRHAKDAIL